ncbi:hypothetical protein [Streptomyces antarcticus]|nr:MULTISPECIES: hypothetical protein [unclassified Streptomyces]MCY0945479.1 hypothetical protein [Streptomyces sp. H34-AA3]MCY0953126.1 hypothetical protein [Streptomyces sp. H27-S2]MCZ4083600.1 hypothetical protein [Streptomyces sp. H34-S5]
MSIEFALSPQARGEWIPEGWHLPVLLVCLAMLVSTVLVARHRRKK